MHPMAKDVRTDILIENFASLELPLPSSFATRTLQINQKINKHTRHKIIHFLCKLDKATRIRFLFKRYFSFFIYYISIQLEFLKKKKKYTIRKLQLRSIPI